ncbi:MAG TPA: molybdate ABC transporter substrate-binding protein [Thermoanaerobaculia bacterium]|nr:molybdate ABC transporter substrate-binding protein [Thermoanaerobaculia bacterium]
MRSFLLTAWLLITSTISAAEVRVFAAASLREALEEIAAGYEGDEIVFSFGASSTLARQIQEGAPADVFLSADEEKVNALWKRGLIVTSWSVLSNSLVIVVPKDAPSRRLIDMRAIALAEPSTVPAGIYARLYLQRIGLWERLKTKIIPTDNVRSALAAVESGNVDAAFVYKTDARIAKQVRVAFVVPREQAPKISYPFALVKGARPAAQRLLAHLRSKAALDVFAKHGFVIP